MNVIGIGYQGVTLPVLRDRLRAAEIDVVYDVRLTPLSRKPGLSKSALSAGLAEGGMSYVHLPALGNPKWNREGFGGDPTQLSEATGNFQDLMLSSAAAQEALGKIRDATCTQRAALLCFEADADRCHRKVILAHLASGDNEPAGHGISGQFALL